MNETKYSKKGNPGFIHQGSTKKNHHFPNLLWPAVAWSSSELSGPGGSSKTVFQFDMLKKSGCNGKTFEAPVIKRSALLPLACLLSPLHSKQAATALAATATHPLRWEQRLFFLIKMYLHINSENPAHPFPGDNGQAFAPFFDRHPTNYTPPLLHP
jgi:hypothetical protein